jgi:signal transduction histidine kinase
MIRFGLRPADWPLTLKVPMLVAALTVVVALVIGNVVLRRLAADQETTLRELTEAYLDGLSTAVMPSVIRRDVWETFDALDRSRALYTGVQARYAAVLLPDGTVLAASDPEAFPIGSAIPADVVQHLPQPGKLALDEAAGAAWVHRTLRQGGVELGSIVAEIDIADLLQVRREVLAWLILANGSLTLLLAAGGYLAARRMVRPIALLIDHVERARGGSVEPIPDRHLVDQRGEIGRLLTSFNAMAAAWRERESLAARLAEEEKAALLGKLASGMAHEVNNPLGGMLNVINTLRKHGDDAGVRARSLDLLERGLTGIANVVRATLATYKGTAAPDALDRRDLDDLQFLIQHEVRQRRIAVAWSNALPDRLPVDGSAVRQIALNLLLNACAVSPEHGTVGLDARVLGGCLHVTVRDEGPGLPSNVLAFLGDAATYGTPPQHSVGLGVWTVRLLAARLNGRIVVESTGDGTAITIILPLAAEDRLDAVA